MDNKMSFIDIIAKVHKDVGKPLPHEIKYAIANYKDIGFSRLYGYTGDLINYLAEQHKVSAKRLLDSYIFGHKNLNNVEKTSKSEKIVINRNLYTYTGLSTFLKVGGESKYVELTEFEKYLYLFTNVRNVASFLKYVEGTLLHKQAKSLYILNQIIRETLIYKHRTTFAFKFFRYLSYINHEDINEDDLNLLIGLHSPEEKKAIDNFLKEANAQFFIDNIPLAEKLERIREISTLDGGDYKFLYELVNMKVQDFELFISNCLKNRCDIYPIAEKKIQVLALLVGYFDIKPSTQLISDLMANSFCKKTKDVIKTVLNNYFIENLAEKAPEMRGYIKSDSFAEFKEKLSKINSLDNFVDLLEQNINHIVSENSADYIKLKILKEYERLCAKFKVENVKVFYDKQLLFFEKMENNKSLWGILVHLLTTSSFRLSSYMEEMLKSLERKGCMEARMCLVNAYLNGYYYILKNPDKAKAMLEK